MVNPLNDQQLLDLVNRIKVPCVNGETGAYYESDSNQLDIKADIEGYIAVLPANRYKTMNGFELFIEDLKEFIYETFIPSDEFYDLHNEEGVGSTSKTGKQSNNKKAAGREEYEQMVYPQWD